MEALTVTERVEGTRRILSTGSLDLIVCQDFGDGEPRALDTDLGKFLEFADARMIRKLIERHIKEGNINPSEVMYTVERPSGGRPPRAWALTEADALFITAKSETPKANEILRKMIAAYLAVRKHLASTVAVAAHARKPPQVKAAPRALTAPPVRNVYRAVTMGTGITELRVLVSDATLNSLEIASRRRGCTVEEHVRMVLSAWGLQSRAMGLG